MFYDNGISVDNYVETSFELNLIDPFESIEDDGFFNSLGFVSMCYTVCCLAFLGVLGVCSNLIAKAMGKFEDYNTKDFNN